MYCCFQFKANRRRTQYFMRFSYRSNIISIAYFSLCITNPKYVRKIFSVFSYRIIIIEISEVNGCCICCWEKIPWILSISIHHSYRIVQTEHIRANMIIFLSHWVNTCPTAKYLVIHSCSIVVEAQTMHEIQLLAIELVALKTGDLIAMVVLTESVAKGIIVIYLQPINP